MGTFSPRDAIIPFWVWQGIYNGSNFASEIKNNSNMKTILSLILAVLATATTMAQSITGKVVDENNSPLDFVNVVLLKADSTYIAGTVTDENGVETEVTTSCKCVRVIQGEQVVFKRLDVIFEGNNYVLSAEKNDDNDYLSLYDEIIVEGVD